MATVVAAQIVIGQDQKLPTRLILRCVHLPDQAPAHLEAFAVDQNLGAARLQHRYPPPPDPFALVAAIADKDLRHVPIPSLTSDPVPTRFARIRSTLVSHH